MARLGVPVDGWVRKLRAVEDQSATIPRERTSEFGRINYYMGASRSSRRGRAGKKVGFLSILLGALEVEELGGWCEIRAV